jgi:hypothetical protein
MQVKINVDMDVVAEIEHELPKMLASGVGIDEALEWAKTHFVQGISLVRIDPSSTMDGAPAQLASAPAAAAAGE